MNGIVLFARSIAKAVAQDHH